MKTTHLSWRRIELLEVRPVQATSAGHIYPKRQQVYVTALNQLHQQALQHVGTRDLFVPHSQNDLGMCFLIHWTICLKQSSTENCNGYFPKSLENICSLSCDTSA